MVQTGRCIPPSESCPVGSALSCFLPPNPGFGGLSCARVGSRLKYLLPEGSGGTGLEHRKGNVTGVPHGPRPLPETQLVSLSQVSAGCSGSCL